MTVNEMRVIYPNYARKERELAELTVDIKQEDDKVKIEPGRELLTQPGSDPKSLSGSEHGG